MKRLVFLSLISVFLFACSSEEQKLVEAMCKCDQMEPKEKLNCFEDVEVKFPSSAIKEMDPEALADAMYNSSCNVSEDGEGQAFTEEGSKEAAQQLIDYHKNQ